MSLSVNNLISWAKGPKNQRILSLIGREFLLWSGKLRWRKSSKSTSSFSRLSSDQMDKIRDRRLTHMNLKCRLENCQDIHHYLDDKSKMRSRADLSELNSKVLKDNFQFFNFAHFWVCQTVGDLGLKLQLYLRYFGSKINSIFSYNGPIRAKLS